MACRIPDRTSTQAINDVRDKIFFDLIPDNPTQEEVVKSLVQLRGIAKTQAIDNSLLKKGTYLDASGKTEKYTFVDTGGLAASNRTSDETAKSFLKKMGAKAIRINNAPDNKIKALSGTKVHLVMDSLIRLESAKRKLIELPVEQYKGTKEDLAKSIGQTVNSANFHELEQLAKNILDEIEEKQKQIDPNGKAAILPEQFLIDPKIDEAGTEDLVVVFSNGNNFIYDFKTITPNADFKEFTLAGIQMKDWVRGSEWIPWYKVNDFRVTLPKHIRKLEKKHKSKNIGARIIPIHIEHEFKAKADRKEGSVLKDNISLLKADYKKNDYLMPIPIVKEDTGIEPLNKMLDKHLVLKNNLEIQIQKLKEDGVNYDKLKERLNYVNKVINELIVKKDIEYFKEEIRLAGKKYSWNNLNLLNNEDKVSLEKLREIKEDVESLIIIGKNTPYFLEQKGLDPDEFQKELEEYTKLTGTLEVALDKISKVIVNRLLTEGEMQDAKNAAQIGFLDRNFSTFDEIRHPIFEKAFELYSQSTNKTRIAMQSFETKLKNVAVSLEEWGNNNSYRGMDVYKLLIDPSTNNLWNMYKKEFYTNLKQLQENNKKEEVSKLLVKKDNADEIWNKRKQYYKDTLDPEKYKSWEADNLPETYLTKDKWYVYYELNHDNISKEFYTEGYDKIKANKSLLNYYTFWIDNMKNAREILGFGSDYNKIPNNFLPWIKADVLDQLFQGKLSGEGFLASVRDIMYVSEDNTTFGQTTDDSIEDFATGEGLREVPKFFTEPLRNRKGEIDSTLKSFDLNKSMLVFMEMVYNYQNMSTIQTQMEALKDVLTMEDFGEVVVDENGNPVVNVAGKAKKLFGTASNAQELFKKMIDYHVYGVKIQDVNSKKVAQTLLTAKRYQQVKELGLAPITAFANYAGIKANQYFNGVKGYFYNESMWGKSEKMWGQALTNSEEGKKFRALVNFFEPFPGKRANLKARDISSQGWTNKIDQNSLFAGFRIGDENADITVMLSLMQNYGFNKEGNLTRIGSRTDIIPLMDLVKVKGDSFEIKGIYENGKVNFEKYTQFRNLSLSVARSLKGGSNEENQIAMQMSLAGNLMMSFKSWMPALVKERFQGIRYNKSLMTITEGRFAEIEQLVKGLDKEDQTIVQYYFGYVVPQLGKLIGEATTFGLFKYKINEKRAREIFETYKQQNANNQEIQNMTFEDFLDYKKGQLRALAAELRLILGFISMLAFLGGDWDDDGKPDYQQTQFGRIMYRTSNRIRRELMGVINPDDWIVLFRQPMPVMGLLIDAQRLVENSFDGARDLMMGDNYSGTLLWKKKKSKDPSLLYTYYRWIPGHKVLMQMVEPFEQEKKKEF
jgi:hypothetical protein